MVVMAMSVPSIVGVLADKRLRRSLDDFNSLVHEAQDRSVAEHRPYLLVWTDRGVELRPEILLKDDDPKPVAEFAVARNESIGLNLPAALMKNPPWEWIFWPSGTCEPAVVKFAGPNGTWSAKFSPLTARAEVTNYASR